MVAKIKLEMEDNTKRSFEEIARSAEKADKAVHEVGDAMKEMENAADDVFHSIEELKNNLSETDAKLILIKSGFKESEVAAMGLEEQLANARHELDTFASNASQTVAAAGKMSSGLSQADVTLMQMRSTMRGMSGDLDRLEAEERAAAAGADRAARGFDSMGDQAAQAAPQVRRMDSALEGIHAAGSKFLGWMAAIWAFKETFNKMAQGAEFLAEKGNPAFDSLQEKVSKLFDSLMRLAELEGVQEVVEGFGLVIEFVADQIDRNADSIDWLIKRNRDLAFVTAEAAEAMGKAPEGYADMIRLGIKWTEQAEADYKKRYEQERILVQEKRQNAKIDQAMHTLEMERAAQKDEAAAKKIDDIKELARLQEEEVVRIRKLAKEGKASEEEIQASQRRLKLYDQQKADLQNQAEVKAEAATKAAAAKEADAKKAAAEKSAEYAKAENDKKLADFEDYVNKLLQTAESINKQNQGPEVDIETMGGGVASSERVMNFYAEKKVDEAEANLKKQFFGDKKINKDGQVIDEAATERYKFGTREIENWKKKDYQEAGLMDENGKFKDRETERRFNEAVKNEKRWYRKEFFEDAKFSSEGEVVNEAFTEQYRGQRNRVVKQARRDVEKEIKSGAADDELYRMQQDFAQSYIEQEGANRNLSRESVAALEKAVMATAKNKQETEQLAAPVDEINRFIDGVNNRTMAQRKNN